MQSTFQKVKNKLNQILALFGNGYSVYRVPQCCITSRSRWSQFHHENGNQLSLFLPQKKKKKNDFVLLRETKPKKRFSHRTVSMLHYFFPSYKYFLAEVQVIDNEFHCPSCKWYTGPCPLSIGV